jgi:hypothetical protein
MVHGQPDRQANKQHQPNIRSPLGLVAVSGSSDGLVEVQHGGSSSIILALLASKRRSLPYDPQTQLSAGLRRRLLVLPNIAILTRKVSPNTLFFDLQAVVGPTSAIMAACHLAVTVMTPSARQLLGSARFNW